MLLYKLFYDLLNASYYKFVFLLDKIDDFSNIKESRYANVIMEATLFLEINKEYIFADFYDVIIFDRGFYLNQLEMAYYPLMEKSY